MNLLKILFFLITVFYIKFQKVVSLQLDSDGNSTLLGVDSSNQETTESGQVSNIVKVAPAENIVIESESDSSTTSTIGPSTCPTDPTSTESTQSTAATTSTESTQSTAATTSTESTQSTAATTSTESTQSTAATTSTESTKSRTLKCQPLEGSPPTVDTSSTVVPPNDNNISSNPLSIGIIIWLIAAIVSGITFV